MSREIVLGVDFGTSHTSAGAYIGGRVQMVVDNGDELIPSIVHFPERGAPEVGQRAAPFLISDPIATVTSVKRMLGSGGEEQVVRRLSATTPYRITGGPSGSMVLHIRTHDYAVEQIASHLLARVRALAEQRFGCTVRRVVATVSATATARYETSLRMAARLADLDIVGIVAEPIAGAVGIGMNADVDHRRLAVVDFGGGTFDVTLIEQRAARFDVVATGGDSLGGDDLDQALLHGICNHVYRATRCDLLRDPARRQGLTLRCEAIKRALSTELNSRLYMRDAIVEIGGARNLDMLIDRDWVQPLWDPLFVRAVDTIERVMAAGGWRPADLDQLALIGGSALIPRFQQLIRDRYPQVEVVSSDLAGIAVATGATLLTRHDGDAPTVSTGAMA